MTPQTSVKGAAALRRDGESMRVDVGGFALHARWHAPRRGDEAARQQAPVLVYLHSLGSDMRIWDGVIARLPHCAHLRFDQRGHGLSDVPPGPYTVPGLADDLWRLLGAFGLQRVVIVGVSVGGMIAMRAALAHPEAVAGLVLCDTAAKVGDEASWNARIAVVGERGVEGLAEQVLARWYPASFEAERPSAYQDYRQMLIGTPPEGYIATCEALREEDLGPMVGGIRQPALVLCGSEDGSTPPAMVAAFAASLPDARFELIEGAGHLPSSDAPEAVALRVGAFLEEIGSV